MLRYAGILYVAVCLNLHWAAPLLRKSHKREGGTGTRDRMAQPDAPRRPRLPVPSHLPLISLGGEMCGAVREVLVFDYQITLVYSGYI